VSNCFCDGCALPWHEAEHRTKVLGESLEVEHLRAACLQRLQPLTQQNMRDDLVDNMGRGLRHGPRAARRTETAPLATEARELVVAALGAPQPEETVR
jgi:hypothetical protein